MRHTARQSALCLHFTGAALVGMTLLLGCRSAEEPAAPLPLTLVVSCDTAGWIVPCGCSSNQSGGLMRRGDLIERLRRERTVLVADVGGAIDRNTPYDRLKFEAILQGQQAMKVAAHNLGPGEVALGTEYLRKLLADKNVPFVSCNLRDRQGERIAPPYRLVQAAGQSIALIGVLDPQYTADDVQADPPLQSLLDVLPSLRDKADRIVVLAYVPTEQLRELASALPEVDVVVGGPNEQSVPPEQVGPTLLTAVTNKGKFVAQLDAPSAGSRDPWQAQIIELDDAFTDDPQQSENLADFYRRLEELDLRADQTAFVHASLRQLPEMYRVAGTERCRDCHQQDCASWSESAHAHAWQTLVDKRAHVDSYCQQCHTTGFGLAGGFVSAGTSAALTNVGCESCHGPAEHHANNPELATLFAGRAADRCVTCHDVDNSPQFAYDKYWPTIAHGLQRATEPTTSVQVEVPHPDEEVQEP